mmetsp:Transcript_25070/g.49952  ORF Transcript_25070/g.49952 Transcript_25070/m.49952 type:complete len:331 (-) Transcript_25070:1924-2916(-)
MMFVFTRELRSWEPSHSDFAAFAFDRSAETAREWQVMWMQFAALTVEYVLSVFDGVAASRECSFLCPRARSSRAESESSWTCVIGSALSGRTLISASSSAPLRLLTPTAAVTRLRPKSASLEMAAGRLLNNGAPSTWPIPGIEILVAYAYSPRTPSGLNSYPSPQTTHVSASSSSSIASISIIQAGLAALAVVFLGASAFNACSRRLSDNCFFLAFSACCSPSIRVAADEPPKQPVTFSTNFSASIPISPKPDPDASQKTESTASSTASQKLGNFASATITTSASLSPGLAKNSSHAKVIVAFSGSTSQMLPSSCSASEEGGAQGGHPSE